MVYNLYPLSDIPGLLFWSRSKRYS